MKNRTCLKFVQTRESALLSHRSGLAYRACFAHTPTTEIPILDSWLWLVIVFCCGLFGMSDAIYAGQSWLELKTKQFHIKLIQKLSSLLKTTVGTDRLESTTILEGRFVSISA